MSPARAVEVVRETDLPAEPLWAALSDLPSWPAWLDTVKALTPLEPGRPAEVGAAYRLDQPRLPEMVWRITRWEPGRGFVWRSSRPGIVCTGTHALEATTSGTRLRLGMTFTGPLSVPAGWFTGRVARTYVEREAEAVVARARSLWAAAG